MEHMLDINFVQNNPEIVKENIRKKFQDVKLPLVDEVIELNNYYEKQKPVITCRPPELHGLNPVDFDKFRLSPIEYKGKKGFMMKKYLKEG